MVEKINLWNFDEFENFFLEEEDTVKICVFSSLLFENWPFKHKKNRHWSKLIRKIMKKIDNVYEQYFNDGFQYKTFSPEDKIVLCVLFGLIQRIFGFSEEPPALKLQDRILKFAICFDLDVIIMTFTTIYMIGEPLSFSRTNSSHYEIFYKLAEFDSSFNDTFTHIKDKVFRPIPNLIMKKSPIDTFWESSSSFKASDTYITVLRKITDKNEQFRTILKQNSIMIIFSTLNSNEYYHRLSSTYDILDLERDRDFIKNLNVDKILGNEKNKFMEIIEKANLKGKLESFYKEAGDYKQVYKHLSFVRDLDLEVKWCFERYLIFCAGYDLNIVHFIYILELGEPNGFFYQSLENALRSPEYDKLNIFSLFESLIRFENQTIINCDIILDFILKYLNSKNNDNLQCFLKNILIFIKENDDCAAALLKENCVEKFCEYLENNNINENKDIFIVLIDILFHLYKKQNTKLEPFEESRFSSVCLKLISFKNEQVSIRCFNIFSYFINADPLSIETLSKLGIDKLLENVNDLTCNEQLGICLINFIDALSLNIQYAKKLRDESLFSSILSGLNIYDIEAPLLPDGNLIDSISIFLRHHPEYNEEYSLFCIDRFEKMVEAYKAKNPLETEIRAVENFLESFSHLKGNTVLDKKDYKEKMVKLLVELYDQVSIRDNQPVSSIFTLYQMFVSILGYLDNEKLAVQFIIPKLENVVNKMKKDDRKGEEYKFLMLKGEKLVSLISGLINNFVTGKSFNRSLLEKAVKYSLDLFILTIDYIDGTYDHDIMGGSFIPSYIDLGSKFNKEQNDNRDNFKLSSILICLNNVFLLKYAIEDFDTVTITNDQTFFDKYLSLTL